MTAHEHKLRAVLTISQYLQAASHGIEFSGVDQAALEIVEDIGAWVKQEVLGEMILAAVPKIQPQSQTAPAKGVKGGQAG